MAGSHRKTISGDLTRIILTTVSHFELAVNPEGQIRPQLFPEDLPGNMRVSGVSGLELKYRFGIELAVWN